MTHTSIPNTYHHPLFFVSVRVSLKQRGWRTGGGKQRRVKADLADQAGHHDIRRANAKRDDIYDRHDPATRKEPTRTLAQRTAQIRRKQMRIDTSGYYKT